jgi:hypothetical protein
MENMYSTQYVFISLLLLCLIMCTYFVPGGVLEDHRKNMVTNCMGEKMFLSRKTKTVNVTPIVKIL